LSLAVAKTKSKEGIENDGKQTASSFAQRFFVESQSIVV
jgi:hypothetical protein